MKLAEAQDSKEQASSSHRSVQSAKVQEGHSTSMANYKTGAQRYNDRMDKIFATSKVLNEKYHGVDRFGSEKKSSKGRKKALEQKKK